MPTSIKNLYHTQVATGTLIISVAVTLTWYYQFIINYLSAETLVLSIYYQLVAGRDWRRYPRCEISLLTSDQVSAQTPAAWYPLIGVLSVGLPIVLHQLL